MDEGSPLDTIVIEHVPVAELPPAWRARLAQPSDATVTVRIEGEPRAAPQPQAYATDDPAFGIWRDHADSADVQTYVRKLRAPRYNRDGSRNGP